MHDYSTCDLRIKCDKMSTELCGEVGMKRYCFKECISIRHSNDGKEENIHIHTVEIVAFIIVDETKSGLGRFSDLESIVKQVAEPYKNCYLNELEGFSERSHIEYLGEILFAKLEEELYKREIYLERFEISENPLRTYILTRRK